jgi:hypothetical protein
VVVWNSVASRFNVGGATALRDNANYDLSILHITVMVGNTYEDDFCDRNRAASCPLGRMGSVSWGSFLGVGPG